MCSYWKLRWKQYDWGLKVSLASRVCPSQEWGCADHGEGGGLSVAMYPFSISVTLSPGPSSWSADQVQNTPKCLTFSRVTARNQVAHTLFEDWSVLFWCVLLEITSFPSRLGSGCIPAVSPRVAALAPFLSRGCEWGSTSLSDGDGRAKPSLREGARIRVPG